MTKDNRFQMIIKFLSAYSSPSLIRPPYLQKNCGHISMIREVAVDEEDVKSAAAENNYGLIREGGFC